MIFQALPFKKQYCFFDEKITAGTVININIILASLQIVFLGLIHSCVCIFPLLSTEKKKKKMKFDSENSNKASICKMNTYDPSWISAE